jgi:hypothetical protein
MPNARAPLPAEALPISDFYTLLDSRTYIRNQNRIVALCALESRQGRKELKLYEWAWRGDERGWKVALANLNVQNIDLRRVASDAEELSKAHSISLRWNA